jgi:ribonuclease-3 family protein
MHAGLTDVLDCTHCHILNHLLPELTETEQEVVRRGRNAKSNSKPKSANYGTYHAATGFEALWGYLHLAGETDRMAELFDKIIAYGVE